MTNVPKVGSTASSSVLRNTRRSYIKDALGQRGFRPTFRSRMLGTYSSILKSLSKDKYKDFMGLLDRINLHIRENYAVDEHELLPLTLPPADSLRIVDFMRLISNNEAMRQVFERCVMPSGRSEVNLNVLPWIYNNYVVNQ